MSEEGTCTVSKFGGTSVGSAEAIMRSAGIVSKRVTKGLVVVSATSGTTDLLTKIAAMASTQCIEEVQDLLQKLRSRHEQIANALGLDETTLADLEALLVEAETIAQGMFLLGEASPRSKDQLLSIGERLSSLFFVHALKTLDVDAELFDARHVMITDEKYGCAVPETEALKRLVNERLSPKINAGKIVVTQGFIGATEEGITTTLGRGGSDYSASLFGEALDAKYVEIWTDVPGIASADPRVVPHAEPIGEISFAEAAELATFGAKVLHPSTLWPAIRQNIPVFVGSSFDENLRGTWIRKDVDHTPHVRGIAVRKNQTLVTVSTLNMLCRPGFLSQVFGVLADAEISVDVVTTSEVSVSLTIDTPLLLTKETMRRLRAIADVKVEEGLALVAIIGNMITVTPGIAAKSFSSINKQNVRLISHGASEHNFCILVEGSQADHIMLNLYDTLLGAKQ